MSSQLRDFQIELKRGVRAAWAHGARNVMMVTATGGGKTVTFCNIVAEETTPCVLISHRQELVAQAALSLNREGVPHGIIAPAAIQRQIVTLEQELFGRSYYSPRADVRVAGVDTLIRLDANSDPWLKRVGLVVQDEGHHVLAANKWGQAQAMFPGAQGLLVTAHAHRADGKGLGRHADGIVDALVVGPSGRNLIDRGFLCDYRLIVPPSDVHLTDDDISAATGDYKQDRAREAVHRSKTIVGDVVKHYLKFAAGKLGITFAVDIQSATEIAAKYRGAGVPAQIITSNTPLHERGQLMRFFRSRKLLQLVSVDVLGEGVDVPAVEVVSMARPTASFQLFAQQFGRALRLMLTDEQNRTWNDRTDAERRAEIARSAKPKALIIDHVENYAHHGLPDVDRTYSLDRRGPRKRAKKDDIPLRQCLNAECYAAYPATMNACPVCGQPKPAPAARGTPAEVDGNCEELDPAVLERMRAEQARIDGPAPLAGNDIVGRSIQKQHRSRQDAQADLRAAMATWAGWQKHQGRETAAEVQRTFYFKFGIDVMSAQILSASDAAELRARIDAELTANRVEGAA